MTEQAASTDQLPPPSDAAGSPSAAVQPWVQRPDLTLAAITIGVLLVAGVLAGFAWAAWSHTATRGLVYTKTAIIPDQTEGFVSSDGRFVVITAAIGLIAGLIGWRRRGERGPVTVAALGVGAVAGALLTDLVGRWVGGGSSSGSVGVVVPRLPLQVHAAGCLFVEAALAVGVYVLFAAFTNPDDLGRPLVGPGFHVQDAGRDGDTAGALEQHDLSA